MLYIATQTNDTKCVDSVHGGPADVLAVLLWWQLRHWKTQTCKQLRHGGHSDMSAD